DEAMQHFRTALALAPPDSQQRAPLLHGLGDAALMADALSEAATAYEAAEVVWRAADDTLAAARAAHGRGRALLRVEEHAAGQASLERALALVEGQECAEAVEILTDLAYLLAVSMGRQTEALAHTQRAREIAERLDNPHVLAAALRAAGNLTARG